MMKRMCFPNPKLRPTLVYRSRWIFHAGTIGIFCVGRVNTDGHKNILIPKIPYYPAVSIWSPGSSKPVLQGLTGPSKGSKLTGISFPNGESPLPCWPNEPLVLQKAGCSTQVKISTFQAPSGMMDSNSGGNSNTAAVWSEIRFPTNCAPSRISLMGIGRFGLVDFLRPIIYRSEERRVGKD